LGKHVILDLLLLICAVSNDDLETNLILEIRMDIKGRFQCKKCFQFRSKMDIYPGLDLG
jgi:hypothetical protein